MAENQHFVSNDLLISDQVHDALEGQIRAAEGPIIRAGEHDDLVIAAALVCWWARNDRL